MQENKLTGKEYIKTLDRELVEALKDIIIKEKETSRLIRKTATEDFIEDLCQIIDNYSSHWIKGGN